MTREEHYKEAERLLAMVPFPDSEHPVNPAHKLLLKKAAIHAALASSPVEPDLPEPFTVAPNWPWPYPGHNPPPWPQTDPNVWVYRT